MVSEWNGTNIMFMHLLVKQIIFYNPYKGPFAVLGIKWYQYLNLLGGTELDIPS